MYVGVDLGFHAVKAICGERWTRFPSYATRPAESLFSMNGHREIVIEAGAQGTYSIGEEAIKKGRAGARQETAGWITSPEYLALFRGALSELTRATSARVRVVTGLPIGDFRQDRNTLRARLEGSHAFTRRGRRKQRIYVDAVRVVPQAWGAVLALLLDAQGRIARSELVDQKVAVLDIGGHTVNYLSVNGLTDVPEESRSTKRGAWNVMRAVRAYLDAEHRGLDRLRDHQVMQAAIAGEIYVRGERVDLAPVVGPILADIGREIVATAEQYWEIDALTFRQVIVCGGGAYLWGDLIKRAFRQAVVLDRPEMANARGFHRFAVHVGGQDG